MKLEYDVLEERTAMNRAIKAVVFTVCLAGTAGLYGSTLASDRIIPTGPEVELGSAVPYMQEEAGEETSVEPAAESIRESAAVLSTELNTEISSGKVQDDTSEKTSEESPEKTSERTADNSMSALETEKQEEGAVEYFAKSGKVIEVPYISQSGDWPTGCESVSTVMLLQFLGFDVDVDTFIENYLPAEDMIYTKNTLYGPDPRKAFAGSPYDENSFGCYTGVILEAVRRCIVSQKPKEQNWEVLDLTDLPMETLLTDYIDQGMPVIFWATIDMRPSMRGPSWTIKDSGGTFIWTSNEHCMLLVGYDDDHYFFNDPWNDNGCIGYEKSLVEERHREMFNMAVGIRRL